MNSAENDFALLLSQHRPRIERWLLRKNIPPADVPDIAQKVIMRAFERRHLYDPTKSLVGWLHRLMRNAVSEYWAKVGVEEAAKSLLVGEDATSSNPEKDIHNLEIDTLVTAVIDALAPKRRDLMIARFVDDLSVEEIAESFDMPIATVKTTITRTLDTCRRALISRGIKDAKRGRLAALVWERDENGGSDAAPDSTREDPRSELAPREAPRSELAPREAPRSELAPRSTREAPRPERRGRVHVLRARLRTLIPDAAAGGLLVYLFTRGIAALHMPAPVILAPIVEGRSATLAAAAILHVASHPAPCPQAVPLPAPPVAAPAANRPPGDDVDPRTRARVRERGVVPEQSERKQDAPGTTEGPHA
jgi:RNA polymerase sigma-70 factor (ECF subfamily)